MKLPKLAAKARPMSDTALARLIRQLNRGEDDLGRYDAAELITKLVARVLRDDEIKQLLRDAFHDELRYTPCGE